MRTKHRALLACLLLLGLSTLAIGQGAIKEDAESFAIQTEDLGFRIMKATGHSKSGGGIYIYDGTDKKDLPLEKVKRIESANGALTIEWATPDDAPGIQCEIIPQKRHVVFAVKLSNQTQMEQWLEARLRFFLKLPEERRFWDGFELYENPAEEKSRTKLRGTFPMCCAYAGRAAVALGIEPLQYLSYLEPAFAPGGERSEVRFATRVVIDPGKEETVRFIMYSFDAAHGYNAALQKYHELFPDVFLPRPDVDPRVSLNGATYAAWTARPQPEICRRFRAGWEWCYAPFKRTGDWLCKEDLWEYEPVREIKGVRTRPIAEYREWRRNQMLNGRLCDVGMMFYIPSCVWCEEKLARGIYSDALTTDPTVTTYFGKPWVTGHDNELRVFPWGNKFGDACIADMKKIAETLDIAGFAFDTAEGGAKYRGPGVKNTPGRAWDDEGVYCDEGMAIGKLMDFVHSLQKDGRTLSVVSNPTAAPVYICAFKSDSAMFEGTPWGRHGGVPPVHLRQFLGKKTLVWWEDFLLEKVATRWEELTPEQIKDAYLGLADCVILKSAMLGGLPTPRISRGVPKIVKCIPALMDMIHAGWEPVTGVECKEDVWVGRFGRSVNTLISLGNATLDSRTCPMAIDNKVLGKCSYLFSTYEGGKVKSLVEGNKTRIDVPMTPRGLVALRAQLGVYPPMRLTASVSETIAADTREVTAKVQAQERGRARMLCRIPEGYRGAAVKVNGQNVPHKIMKGKVNFVVTLVGKPSISVTFKSNTFDSPEAELRKYAFVAAGKPTCQIVVRDDASDEETYAAQRLQLYFKVYYERAAEPKAKVEIPIVKASELKGDETNLVVIDGSVDEALIQKILGSGIRDEARAKCVKLAKEGAVLCIGASTPAGAKEATFDLLRVLDKEYPYYGGFQKSEAAVKAGLVGKILE